MLAFMVFLIYNSFLAIAVLPKPYGPLKINSSNSTTENKLNENPSTLTIYMHVFVASYEEFNSNDYIPYIQTIAKKYTNFKYKLFVVVNDSTEDSTNDNISDKQINELALNSLWTDNEIIISKTKLYENLTVQHISLTEYMDTSPLKKYWRLLPHQFIGFFARCIAVWDKGGVAINPLILTPKSPNSVYIEKLYSILEKFQSKHKLMPIQKRKISKKSKKKLNNIRDIIIDLEKDDNVNEYILTDSLAVAENIPTIAATSFTTKRNANYISFDQRNPPQSIEKQNDEVWRKNNSDKENTIKSGNSISPIKAINDTNGVAAAQKILPKFLELLFQLNSKNLTSTSQNLKNFTREFKLSDNPLLNDSLSNVIASNIDSAVNKSIVKIKTKSTNKTFSGNESTKLIIIDLKGNLIATEIACHAFIGTVLGNILHSTDYESLTDFMMNELSLFCKGNLSTCNNVEIILV